MKKILFAVAFAVGAMGVSSAASADDHRPIVVVKHPHHRVVCHNVRVHGHFVKRCR
jgi:hypothetical protein